MSHLKETNTLLFPGVESELLGRPAQSTVNLTD